jgi:hypothetical protein
MQKREIGCWIISIGHDTLIYVDRVVLSQWATNPDCNLQVSHAKNRSRTDLKTNRFVIGQENRPSLTHMIWRGAIHQSTFVLKDFLIHRCFSRPNLQWACLVRLLNLLLLLLLNLLLLL